MIIIMTITIIIIIITNNICTAQDYSATNVLC